MKQLAALVSAPLFTLAASTAMAERINVASNATVQQSVERLTQAVETAGAHVFTTVDFKEGAEMVGKTLRSTTVVIFGSPKIGEAALLDGQTMALYLPLRILFFEDANGQTWASYDELTAVALTHGLPADNRAVLAMKAALEKFSTIAAGRQGPAQAGRALEPGLLFSQFQPPRFLFRPAPERERRWRALAAARTMDEIRSMTLRRRFDVIDR